MRGHEACGAQSDLAFLFSRKTENEFCFPDRQSYLVTMQRTDDPIAFEQQVSYTRSVKMKNIHYLSLKSKAHADREQIEYRSNCCKAQNNNKDSRNGVKCFHGVYTVTYQDAMSDGSTLNHFHQAWGQLSSKLRCSRLDSNPGWHLFIRSVATYELTLQYSALRVLNEAKLN